jgi:sugar lactone lactonase YvrE
MADIITLKKERIGSETEEIISKIKEQDLDAEMKLSKCTAHYSNLMKESKEKRKQWHVEVDDIFDHLDTLTQSLRDYQTTALKSYQSQLRSQNSSMIQIVKENKEILKSNNVSDVNNHHSKLTEFRNIPQVPDLTLPSLTTNSVKGREISLQLEDYKVKLTKSTLSSLTDEASSLSLTEFLIEAKVIANIQTNVKELQRIACVGSDRAWVSGRDKKIHCVDIHGTVTDTVTSTCPNRPADITVNRQGELIYSDSYNRTVNIVRHGKTEALITTPQGWYPGGLCCTRSGDILVSMCTADNSHHKIVRYEGQRVAQEIDRDERGNPIYQGGKYGVFISDNINGDIVASDVNADKVVVVDGTGKVRFRYNDKLPGEKNPFCPSQIVTDSMGHIILGEEFNNCLHILDQSGRFLQCVDCGLNNPGGLSVDSEGRLWVVQFELGEVIVIQYMK